MDYYEYNATNPKNKSGGNKFILLKNIAISAIIISFLLIGTLMNWKNEDVPTSLTVFYNILIILLIELPLFGCYFLFRKMASRYVEYDYFILGNMLKVVKISNKINRKSMLELYLNDIENIGIYTSANYEKVAMGDFTVKSFACNINSPLYLYIAAPGNRGERNIYVLEYDVMFVTALRKALKKESVFDKDLLLLLKKADKTPSDSPAENAQSEVPDNSHNNNSEEAKQ